MIANSTLGAAVLDASQPFGIPYHGRINLPEDLSTASFDLPNGETRPFVYSSMDLPVANSSRYQRGTQVFKVRDGAPPQTAEQRAAGQRYTDYAIIHSYATSPPKALIGGAVVENGSYLYHSTVSGNWLIGVSGRVEHNVATVKLTLTPFGVLGDDARQPVTRTLTLTEAGQNDAESKPILGLDGSGYGAVTPYAQWSFGVTFHTASHDGGHASLVVWTEYAAYRTGQSGENLGWTYSRVFPVGWLALALSEPQGATALTPPDATLSVLFDRVQTLGVRFTDDFTGASAFDQSFVGGDPVPVTRPTVRFLTDGTQEITRTSAWGPEYDDQRSDLTTRYLIEPFQGQAQVSTRIAGYDRRIVSVWYAPAQSTPMPVKLTHYDAASQRIDDACTVQGSQQETWATTWQYDAQGVPTGVYLDRDATADASGVLRWRDIITTSTRLAVRLGEAVVLEGGQHTTLTQTTTWDYATSKEEHFHGMTNVLPSFWTLPMDAALVVGRPDPVYESSTEVSGTPMAVGNFAGEFRLVGVERAAAKDYILPHLMDLGNEPLSLALVVDGQPKLLCWPDLREVTPDTDPRSPGGVTGQYAASGPVLLQCASHAVLDDPAHQTPRVYLSFWSGNFGGTPREQGVNLVCL